MKNCRHGPLLGWWPQPLATVKQAVERTGKWLCFRTCLECSLDFSRAASSHSPMPATLTAMRSPGQPAFVHSRKTFTPGELVCWFFIPMGITVLPEFILRLGSLCYFCVLAGKGRCGTENQSSYFVQMCFENSKKQLPFWSQTSLDVISECVDFKF